MRVDGDAFGKLLRPRAGWRGGKPHLAPCKREPEPDQRDQQDHEQDSEAASHGKQYESIRECRRGSTCENRSRATTTLRGSCARLKKLCHSLRLQPPRCATRATTKTT